MRELRVIVKAMGAYLEALEVVTAARPLGNPLPDIDVRLPRELVEAPEVTEALRAAAGTALHLASEQAAAARLTELAIAGRLDVRVLMVPPRYADSATPQFGMARAIMGVSINRDVLSIDGSQPDQPTAEVRMYSIGRFSLGHNVWMPESATGGPPHAGIQSLGAMALPREWQPNHWDERGGYNGLVAAAAVLGQIARSTSEHRDAGYWMPQVMVGGRIVRR